MFCFALLDAISVSAADPTVISSDHTNSVSLPGPVSIESVSLAARMREERFKQEQQQQQRQLGASVNDLTRTQAAIISRLAQLEAELGVGTGSGGVVGAMASPALLHLQPDWLRQHNTNQGDNNSGNSNSSNGRGGWRGIADGTLTGNSSDAHDPDLRAVPGGRGGEGDLFGSSVLLHLRSKLHKLHLEVDVVTGQQQDMRHEWRQQQQEVRQQQQQVEREREEVKVQQERLEKQQVQAQQLRAQWPPTGAELLSTLAPLLETVRHQVK